MTDDYAEGYVEFESYIGNLQFRRNLSDKDIKEYFKMWNEAQQ